MRLTMSSPSSLTVHLSQANISILSIPELTKLLCDEVEKLVLERICGLGRQICNDVGGIWFVDMNRCVGRWDGGAMSAETLSVRLVTLADYVCFTATFTL